jgi:hypothetical protein
MPFVILSRVGVIADSTDNGHREPRHHASRFHLLYRQCHPRGAARARRRKHWRSSLGCGVSGVWHPPSLSVEEWRASFCLQGDIGLVQRLAGYTRGHLTAKFVLMVMMRRRHGVTVPPWAPEVEMTGYSAVWLLPSRQTTWKFTLCPGRSKSQRGRTLLKHTSLMPRVNSDNKTTSRSNIP